MRKGEGERGRERELSVECEAKPTSSSTTEKCITVTKVIYVYLEGILYSKRNNYILVKVAINYFV